MLKRILISTTVLITLSNPAVSHADSTKPKSCPEYEAMIRKHGLPVKEFSFYMWRESKCEPKAIGWNYRNGTDHNNCVLTPAATYKNCRAIRSYDIGLLQVNSGHKTITAQICKRPRRQLIKSLTDPSCNLKVAKYLYDNGGSAHWKGSSGIHK
jgi:hypothetical protein